jgi:hypothetical protein
LQTLLLTPLVGASPLIRDEILLEAARCQTILSKSVGVRLSDQAATPSSGLQIDGGLVAALLQTSKGKKLMTRSLSLLPAEQRYFLSLRFFISDKVVIDTNSRLSTFAKRSHGSIN